MVVPMASMMRWVDWLELTQTVPAVFQVVPSVADSPARRHTRVRVETAQPLLSWKR